MSKRKPATKVDQEDDDDDSLPDLIASSSLHTILAAQGKLPGSSPSSTSSTAVAANKQAEAAKKEAAKKQEEAKKEAERKDEEARKEAIRKEVERRKEALRKEAERKAEEEAKKATTRKEEAASQEAAKKKETAKKENAPPAATSAKLTMNGHANEDEDTPVRGIMPMQTPIPTRIDEEDEVDDIISSKLETLEIFSKVKVPITATNTSKTLQPVEAKAATSNAPTPLPVKPTSTVTAQPPATADAKAKEKPAATIAKEKAPASAATVPKAKATTPVPVVAPTKIVAQEDDDEDLPLLEPADSKKTNVPEPQSHSQYDISFSVTRVEPLLSRLELFNDAVFVVSSMATLSIGFADKNHPEYTWLILQGSELDMSVAKSGAFSLTKKNMTLFVRALRVLRFRPALDVCMSVGAEAKKEFRVHVVAGREQLFKCETKIVNPDKWPQPIHIQNPPSKVTLQGLKMLNILAHLSQLGYAVELELNAKELRFKMNDSMLVLSHTSPGSSPITRTLPIARLMNVLRHATLMTNEEFLCNLVFLGDNSLAVLEIPGKSSLQALVKQEKKKAS